MSTYSWDPNDGLVAPPPEPTRKLRLTVRCEYPDAPIEPIEVTLNLSLSYGIRNVDDTHGWFRCMMREREAFEVETDGAGESSLSFLSGTVKQVLVE